MPDRPEIPFKKGGGDKLVLKNTSHTHVRKACRSDTPKKPTPINKKADTWKDRAREGAPGTDGR